MAAISIKKPYPKQELFLKSRTKYTAYGGARGGGKSHAARTKAILLCLRYAGIQVLFLRRTYAELKENHLMPALQEIGGAAKYRAADKSFDFPNGSRLKFGYMAAEKDALQYQGQAYDVIFLEEATQFTEQQFMILTECNRSSGLMREKLEPRMYFTCNPGGVGHAWMKRLFIDRDYKETEHPEEYAFISAQVYDNPFLLEHSPSYVRTLENLPEDRKRAMLYGDWDVFEGQYFPEFRRELHTCEPFPIPRHWRRYVVFDYGFDMFACYFIATDEDGTAYVYKELCEGKDLGEGHDGLIVSDAANWILRATEKEETIYAYIAPADMWNRRQDTGKSTAEIFAENGIYLSKSQNSRVKGWMELKEWMKVREGKDGVLRPRLLLFRNCTQLIKCLPVIQHSEKDPNDVALEPHEVTHAPDALRYFVSFRPAAAEKPEQDAEEEIQEYDKNLEEFLNGG